MSDVIQSQLIELVISILSTAITVVILPLVAKFLTAKINNEKINEAITDITNVVSRSVEFVEVRMVQQLKADGKWNSETQKEVLETAVETAMNDLSKVTIKNLKLTAPEIRDLLEKEIEKYILGKKDVKAAIADSSTVSLTGK